MYVLEYSCVLQIHMGILFTSMLIATDVIGLKKKNTRFFSLRHKYYLNIKFKSHVVHLAREKQVLLHLENANISAQNANLLSTYILNQLISKQEVSLKKIIVEANRTCFL